MIQLGKKIPSIMLAASIAAAAVFAIVTVAAQEVHAMSGNGSADKPYVSSSYEDVKESADIVNGMDGDMADPEALAGSGYRIDRSTYNDLAPTAAKDLPPKVTVTVDWEGSELYTYNASDQKPTVNKITVSGGSLAVPGGASDPEYYKKNGTDWEKTTCEPTDPGVYKLSYSIDNGEVTILFVILDGVQDYTVAYQVRTEGAWSPVGDSGTVNAGDYKAVISFTNSLSDLEKEFQIMPARLTITAKDDCLPYNGQTQGPGDTVYANASEVVVKGLQGNDELTKVIVTGQGDVAGRYDLVPSDAAIGVEGALTGNYIITYVNGTFTIEPANVTVITGSASKDHDGTPLTNDEASIDGLVNGEVATVMATGSQTEVGSSDNTYSIEWDTADPKNYSVTEKLGTLTVRPAQGGMSPATGEGDAIFILAALMAVSCAILAISFRKKRAQSVRPKGQKRHDV